MALNAVFWVRPSLPLAPVTTRCTLILSALVLGGVKVGILLVLLIYMFAVLGHGFIGTSGTLLSDPQSKEG